jgi:guanylate kinase
MEKAIIITAPSGAGKTTLVKMLLEKRSDLAFSVSACTRSKRPGETDDKDYYFLSPEAFKTKISNNEFIEWEEVYENMYYGTLYKEIERIWSLGKAVIFDIDVKGAVNLKSKLGEKALSIFIKPPTKDTLRERLILRATEDEATLMKRLDRALEELTYENKMDQVVVNDNLSEAFAELESKINSFLSQ